MPIVNPNIAFPAAQMAADSSQLPTNNQPNPPSQNQFLEDSFNKTNLDLENSDPAGGPINDPNSNFRHFYTPQKPFNITPEGEVRGEGKLQFRTDSTDLDVENPLPNGGPINVPYTTRIGNESFTFSTTQPFTPRNTYADSFNPIPPGITR
jgi:hypothetical protein